MIHSTFIDSALIRIFRFRTRGFLRMAESDGAVPPVPREGGCYLYVHIPFCEVLCPFCSFHRVQHCHEAAVRYFAALRAEIWHYQHAGFKFDGVYFGGGTPTTEPDELIETIGLVKRLFGVREISVETNPKDLQPALLGRLREAGVTRLSVGVQSFDDTLLREMERYEKYGSGADTAERIRAAAGMFPTLNVDLIFNQAHQTLESFERDLDLFRSLGANQVSCYPLMTAPSVARRMEGAMGAPDRGRLRQFFRIILRKLQPDFTASSAWCFTKRGQGSDEYIVASENYVGVGSGAFSYLDGTLYATSFSLAAYEERIAQGRTGIVTSHRLSEGDRMRYALLVRMFGLGLDREWARRRHGRKFFWRLWGELRTLELLGAARRNARGWVLTEDGMYWLMLMMSEFLESVNGYRDAMRAHVHEELEAYGKPAPSQTEPHPVPMGVTCMESPAPAGPRLTRT
ncbi:MAG: coproporphyrinogen III oxidase family protein [Opitutae bacterium]|nr:coproporphyrinogen III oxidase family protein [Opitutae bacterium]